ncbi:cyanate permease [Conyzicola lurida]|uniref:Cyanate permease n=1 Tax=Conyzicola lurida TaxID=1172621 RepID=A0A841AKD9_9MICO|nr:cyanate permease [Conyzicola lurida]
MNRTPSAPFAIAIAVATTVCGVLPVFLAGSLSVQATADLGLTAAILGIVIAVFWASSSLFSARAGRVAEVWGVRPTLALAVSLALVAMVGVALLSPSWHWFAGWMVLAGAANGFGHPPSNALILAAVPAGRTGAAFGVKQAAIPISTLCAGLAVPLLALTFGWRATFVVGAALCIAALATILIAVPRLPVRAKAAKGQAGITGPLRRYFSLMAVSGFLGVAQANVVGGFTVATASERGFGPAEAGYIVGAASVAGIVVRIAVGIAADRGIGGTMSTVALMLFLGALGLGGIAFGSGPVFIAGCVLAFGAGWGWNGLVHYTIAQRAGAFTASATGLVQGGAYAGGAVGPLLFGALVSHSGLGVGWVAAATCAVAAAIVAYAASRLEGGLSGTGPASSLPPSPARSA